MKTVYLFATLALTVTANNLFAQKLVSDYLKTDIENILINDGFILSDQVKNQERNELWNNPKQKEKVIKQYQLVYDKIQNQIKPLDCTKNPLVESLIIKAESLYTLGSRVIKNGVLSNDLLGSTPEYIVPYGYQIGIPKGQLGQDNSFFNLTSYSLLGLSAENKSNLAFGEKFSAKIEAYLKDSGQNAYQLSYACGTFTNYMGNVAEQIIINQTFSPSDWLIVKDFYDKAHLRNTNDSLIKSFAGVYLISKKGTTTFKQLQVDAAISSNITAGIFNSATKGEVKKEAGQGLVTDASSYKLYFQSRPALQAFPTAAQINAALNSVVKAEVPTKSLSLNETDEQTFTITIDNIDSSIYAKLAIDKDFTQKNIIPAAILKDPVLEKDPVKSNYIGSYNVRVKVGLNENYKIGNTTSAVFKGERFNLPIRLFYANIKGNKDTLVFYETKSELSLKYINYPVLQDNYVFELIDTSNGKYKYRGSIALELASDDVLLDAPGLLVRPLNLTQEQIDAMGINGLNTAVSSAIGFPNKLNRRVYDVEFKVPKATMSKLTEDLKLQFELNIKHNKQQLSGSRRVADIILPISL